MINEEEAAKTAEKAAHLEKLRLEMDAKRLPTGRYTLQRDVKNPEPDKRHKDDWRKWPVIPKGTAFWTCDFYYGAEISIPEIGAGRYEGLYTISPRSALWDLIIPHLTKDPLDAAQVFHAHHHKMSQMSSDVLQLMVDKGRLSLQELDELLTILDAKEEE